VDACDNGGEWRRRGDAHDGGKDAGGKVSSLVDVEADAGGNTGKAVHRDDVVVGLVW